MKLSTNGFIVVCLLLVFLFLGTLFAINRNWFDRGSVQQQPRIAAHSAPADPPPAKSIKRPDYKRQWTERGGVLRPRSDFAEERQEVESTEVNPVSNVGVSPKLPSDLNPNTRSIAAASKSGDFPSRLSVVIEPTPFDKQEYLNDPQPYLDTVEPGRVFQVLNRGPDTKPIGETGEQYFELLQGESAILRAVTDPGMPVTFYSSRLGQFENGLAVQTLPADENGIATATFTASAGTQGEIDIFAGSPTRSGNARYLIRVDVPDDSEGRPGPERLTN